MKTGSILHYDVAALRRDHPIDQVITGYGIELRRAGRALVGRCPLHADGGRPNLHVYPDTQSWYCYRCHIGGDVIEFVRRHEQIDFRKACERLAGVHRRASSPLPSRRWRQRWDRLTLEEQVVMNIACAVYRHALWREPRALSYIRERGIPDWAIRQCAVGYADGHTLETELRRRSDLRAARRLGLLCTAEQGDAGRPLHEFLARRIVVPEFRGAQCLWFIGRTLSDAPQQPKYLALKGERPVLGYERVAGRREIFLVEGVFDYLTAVSWGLPAFSPCGTALPSDRLGFLARTAVVYGVLDNDDAGRDATERFRKQLGARFRPLSLPQGCDLNDLGRRPDGRQEFFRLLRDVRNQVRLEESHAN